MAEYIERGKLLDWFRPYGHMDEKIPFDVLVTDTYDMGEADVAPVRHGRWINGGMNCSECGQGCKDTTNPHKPVPVFLGNMPWCPKCGAKMDGGESDG